MGHNCRTWWACAMGSAWTECPRTETEWYEDAYSFITAMLLRNTLFSNGHQKRTYVTQTEVSLPHSQQLASCLYPESDQSSPCSPQPNSFRSIAILSSLLCLGFPRGPFQSGLPTKILYVRLQSRICATCPAHLILLDALKINILKM